MLIRTQLYSIVTDCTEVDRCALFTSLFCSPPHAVNVLTAGGYNIQPHPYLCAGERSALDQMRREGVLRMFKLPTAADDYACMFTDDYRAQVCSRGRNARGCGCGGYLPTLHRVVGAATPYH